MTDADRWPADLRLIGQWLAQYPSNTKTTYADAIGWPYYVNGEHAGQWRGYGSTRQGLGWLAWCHKRGVRLFDAKRPDALAWVGALERFRNPASGQPFAKRSRAQMVSVASSLYQWAIREGHTEVNPTGMIDREGSGLRPALDPTPTRTLSVTEARAMIRAADNDPVQGVRLRTSAMVALLFQTGIRASEMCGATVGDMFTQDGYRLLRATIKGGRRHLFVLPQPVCTRIDAYLASRQDPGSPSTPLFATWSGKRLGRGELLVTVKRIARLSGIADPDSVHPRVARHTFVTEARRQGYIVESIQRAVGHRDPYDTEKYGLPLLVLEHSPTHGVAVAFESDEMPAALPQAS